MQKDERDLLIKVSTTIEEMRDHQKYIQVVQDKMDIKLDAHIEKDNTFLTKALWMWFTGIMIAVILGSYVFTFELGGDFHDHKTDWQIHSMMDTGHSDEIKAPTNLRATEKGD